MRKLGYQVSDTGYFVYCNGKTDLEAFDGKLEFYIDIIPYTGDASWVEGVLGKIKKCLDGKIPKTGPDCDYCEYREAVEAVEEKSRK